MNESSSHENYTSASKVSNKNECVCVCMSYNDDEDEDEVSHLMSELRSRGGGMAAKFEKHQKFLSYT